MVVPYNESQKRILVEGVENLCQQLARPICSADLNQFYQQHPGRRPILKKRIGQLLLSAARPMGQARTRRIFPVGLFGNRVYYAPNPSPAWLDAFSKYRAVQQLAKLNSLPMADSLDLLEGQATSDHQRDTMTRIRSRWLLEQKILQEAAQGISRVEYPRLPIPQDLKDRAWAWNFLTSLIQGRRPSCQSLSSFRHLAELLWPQSILWEGVSGYLPAQIDAYVRWHWPYPGENQIDFLARRIVLRYGITPPDFPGNY